MSVSAAITNAVCFRNRNSRIASRVEMVVGGRHRSRSSMSTTKVTPSSSRVSSKASRSAWISLGGDLRSEEHTSELQSLMRISYAVFCLKKKKNTYNHRTTNNDNHKHEKHN